MMPTDVSGARVHFEPIEGQEMRFAGLVPRTPLGQRQRDQAIGNAGDREDVRDLARAAPVRSRHVVHDSR